MKGIKIWVAAIAAFTMVFAAAVAPSVVLAQSTKDAVCEGIGLTGGSCTGGDAAIDNVIAQVINILSIVVGVVAVIMIIIGGFKYITSAGDSSKVGSAKNTILYALVGLVIVALAQFIVRFVMSRVGNG